MTWLSGDFIVEMHVHNLDIVNWAIGSHPVQCVGMGGRQQRTAPQFGDVYDHFSAEFEYANGVRMAYMGRTLKWDGALNASKLDLSPPAYEFGDLPMPAVAIPGKTRLM
jgi:predicted dehydrogenase